MCIMPEAADEPPSSLGRPARKAAMRVRTALALAILVATGGAAAPAPTVSAVVTGGKAELTKCYSWFVSATCNIYHHITVPPHIAVGDTVGITYGSNPKHYPFAALSIAVHGDRCTIFGEQQGSPDRVDTLVIRPCREAP
jgi:hypothetical protein